MDLAAAVRREPLAAAEQPSLAVRGRRGGAEDRLAAGALGAQSAARHEREDDVVALADVGDARADRLDDAGRLVPEHHRHGSRAAFRRRPRGRSGRARRRRRAISSSPLPRRRQLELLDRSAGGVSRVGPLGADLVQDGGARDHERNSATMGLNVSGDSRKSRWPPPANRSKREPGIRRASSTPFSYGTTRSASPCTTSVGASICSTGETARRTVRQASYWARQHSGRGRVLEPVGEELLELVRVLVRPAGREGERHRGARELGRRSVGVRLPGGDRLRRVWARWLGPPVAGADEHEPLDELRDAGARASARCSRPSRSRRRARGGLRAPRRRRRPAPRSSTARAASASGRCRGSRPRSRGSCCDQSGIWRCHDQIAYPSPAMRSSGGPSPCSSR